MYDGHSAILPSGLCLGLCVSVCQSAWVSACLSGSHALNELCCCCYGLFVCFVFFVLIDAKTQMQANAQ